MTKAIAAKKLIGAIDGSPSPPKSHVAASAIHLRKANFRDDRFCQMGNLTAEGHAPGLELCRLLLANGFDPAAPLIYLRDGVLAMRIRSIGAGATCASSGRCDRTPALYSFSAHGHSSIKTKPLRPAKGFCCLVRRDRGPPGRSLPPIVEWAGRQALAPHLDNSHPNGWVYGREFSPSETHSMGTRGLSRVQSVTNWNCVA